MNMFCFQCQETRYGKGCTAGGACGKSEETANLQDLLVYTLKGIAILEETRVERGGFIGKDLGDFLFASLYMTVTNTNFDPHRFISRIGEALAVTRGLRAALPAGTLPDPLPDMASWDAREEKLILAKSYTVGVLLTRDEDVRSLRETVTYGLKGIGAYAHHAASLGFYDPALARFVVRALAAISREEDVGRLFDLALGTGKAAIEAMELLDRAHRESLGLPEVTDLDIGTRGRPGILVTGHDLRAMRELLEQSTGAGIDVYTHGEMIAAQYYPAFRNFPHMAGNYGNAWWRQESEFASFNGPILVTSNCIVPVAGAYRDRIYTTGVAGYPGIPHITGQLSGGGTDYGALIARARACPPPVPLESGTRTGGFNHLRLAAVAEKMLDLVKRGSIRRFIVIAGCDGRDAERDYYRKVALALPGDAVILTAGCAKYRFYKLDLGEIEGIPRVLEAGQCNDCYSLIAFAARLREMTGLWDINGLPLSFDIAWYDQKAVLVLLALLHLGIRNIRLGPTLPAFLSPRILGAIVERYAVKTIGTPEGDVALMMEGR